MKCQLVAAIPSTRKTQGLQFHLCHLQKPPVKKTCVSTRNGLLTRNLIPKSLVMADNSLSAIRCAVNTIPDEVTCEFRTEHM